MCAEVSTVTAVGSADDLDRLALVSADLRSAGRISELQHEPGDDDAGLRLTVTLTSP